MFSIFEEEEEVADDGIDEDVEGGSGRSPSSVVGLCRAERSRGGNQGGLCAQKRCGMAGRYQCTGDVHGMQMVSSIVCSPDDNPELALTVADVGKLIVVQVEVLENFLPANGKPFVSKARSIAVGPIEPAPPRVR